MIVHLIQHGEFIKNITEGRTKGKRGRGRPRRPYMEQIKEAERRFLIKKSKNWSLIDKNGECYTDKSVALELMMKI